jgi:hypothetical protein
MNLGEIHIGIRHVLDELEADHSHWTPARLTSFANTALDDIPKRLPAILMPDLEETDTQTLSIGKNEYDMPADFLKPKHVLLNYNPADQDLHLPAAIITHAHLQALVNNTFYDPSTTNSFVIIYGNKATIYPTPTSLAANGLKIIYIRPPVRLVNDEDVPELPSWTHEWIVLYGAYKCLFEDGDERYNKILGEYEGKFVKPGGGNVKSA